MRRASSPVTLTRPALLGVLALALFAFLAVAVQLRLLAGFDLALMQSLRGPDVSWLIGWATLTGVALAGPVSIAYALLAAFLLWRSGAGRWSPAPLAFLLATLVEVAMKSTIDQPGEPLRQFVRGTYYPFLSIDLGGAFPSGHAARTGFLLTFLALWLRSRQGVARRLSMPVCLLPAVAIGFSRLYIADHWPSDILGGLLLGGGIALLAAPPALRRSRAGEAGLPTSPG